MLSARRYEERVLLLLTLVIGAVVGLVVVAFIVVTENLGAKLYPGSAAAWRRLVIPVAGSLISGLLLAKYFPNARGSGIPQTKTALFIRDGFIALRTVIGKFSMSALSLASGIALGREGPSVQVSAGLASVLGRRLGLGPSSVKALLPVGASAALAAAFNTPIAAVLFTLEEVMGDMHAPVLGSIVLASATSWIVLHLILGDEPLFHVPAYQLVHPLEFAVYAALGVAGGLVSVAFVKLLLWQRKHFLRLPKATLWWQPAVGGVAVGILGWFFPKVLGVGYNFVSQALNGEMLVRTMALLVLLKLFATATCYATGNAGGIFGPSLFIGAMLGGTVGGLAHGLLPDYTGSVGAYALVGMGAAFAGIIRVPLTSVIMIFEITRDYSIIVPLMISNLISYFISANLQPESIYEALLHQDGIHLPTGTRAREALLMVRQALHGSPEVLQAQMRVSEAAQAVKKEAGAWTVVDSAGLRGMLRASQLEQALQDGQDSKTLAELVPAPDPSHLDAHDFPHLHADHTLDFAMRRIAETGLKVLPVVSRTNVRELQGVITMDDIVAAYGMGQVGQESEPFLPRQKLVRLLAGIVIVLTCLAVVGGFLNYYYRAARTNRAQHYFEQGNALLAKDLYPEAIEDFRDALSISHSSQNRLALAMALIKAGHLDEAAIYLRELLKNNPNSGPANLGMARIAVREGRIDDAIAFYHHAIYGVWPGNADQQRFQTRLEFVQALGEAGHTQQAQAQLMLLQASGPKDLPVRKQIAPLLLLYGLPKDAAQAFREITERDPQDAKALVGLGESEYQMGDFVSARAAFARALRLNPNDTQAQKRLAACDRIAELDPLRRGLTGAERFQHSQQVLSAILDIIGQCPPPGAAANVDAARKLAVMPRAKSYSEAVDEATTVAEQLWAAIPKGCPAMPPPDAPLSLVMTRLNAR